MSARGVSGYHRAAQQPLHVCGRSLPGTRHRHELGDVTAGHGLFGSHYLGFALARVSALHSA